MFQTNNSKTIPNFYLHSNLKREIKMRIFYFVCLLSFIGNAQVLEVIEVINKLYKLIEVISLTTKFFANIEDECDSHNLHYEVRESHFCANEA